MEWPWQTSNLQLRQGSAATSDANPTTLDSDFMEHGSGDSKVKQCRCSKGATTGACQESLLTVSRRLAICDDQA